MEAVTVYATLARNTLCGNTHKHACVHAYSAFGHVPALQAPEREVLRGGCWLGAQRDDSSQQWFMSLMFLSLCVLALVLMSLGMRAARYFRNRFSVPCSKFLSVAFDTIILVLWVFDLAPPLRERGWGKGPRLSLLLLPCRVVRALEAGFDMSDRRIVVSSVVGRET